jgi:hypothetical protein
VRLAWARRVCSSLAEDLIGRAIYRAGPPQLARVVDAETAEPALHWPNAGCPFLCPFATARIGRRSALGLFPYSRSQYNESAARRADSGGDLRSGLSDPARLLLGVMAAGDQRGSVRFGRLGRASSSPS